ncbi:MAG: hypothetical protein EOP52_06390 [Sphingobacteriales bacterium]|nr:MAG: hypothetical protein EOP52_06390 [Sphingobacteriales bacterium]
MRKLLLAAAIALSGIGLSQSANAQTPISTATLVVRDTAVKPTLVAPTTAITCSGALDTLTITGGNRGFGGKWQWYAGSCGGTPITTDSATGRAILNVPTNSTNAPIVYKYYLRSIGGACASSFCDSTSITVNPAATMIATADDTACNGIARSYTFSSNNTGGAVTYNWVNNNTATGIGASGTGNIPSTTLTNTTNADIVSRIIVTPTFANGGSACSGVSDTFFVVVHPSPNGTLTVNTPICEGQAVNLTYTNTPGLASPAPYALEVRQYNSTTTPPAAPYTQYTGVTSGNAFPGAAPLPTAASTWKFDLMKITDRNGCVRSAQ